MSLPGHGLSTIRPLLMKPPGEVRCRWRGAMSRGTRFALVVALGLACGFGAPVMARADDGTAFANDLSRPSTPDVAMRLGFPVDRWQAEPVSVKPAPASAVRLRVSTSDVLATAAKARKTARAMPTARPLS